MGIFKRTVVAGALALGLATPAAAQFSNVYFFGDSLTAGHGLPAAASFRRCYGS